MCPTLTCLALALVGGVDLGYQPAPDGRSVELIVQIDPATFRTIQPGDPIDAVLRAEAQQFPVSKVTVRVDNVPPPHSLPQPSAARSSAPNRGASTAPAPAPIVPASRLPSSPVLPATANAPLGAPDGPLLGQSAESGPLRVAPPGGEPLVKRTTNEQTRGANDLAASSTLVPSSQDGNATFSGLTPVDGGKSAGATIDRWELLLYLAIIALAASNGYVGWLFYDARQRYISLLSSKFAVAK